MANIGNGLALRVCDLCGGVDDHPRHVQMGTAGEVFPAPTDEVVAKVVAAAADAGPDDAARLLRDLLDTSSSDRHLDCCREAGCPLPAGDPNNCANRTAGAEDLRGAELVDHLIKEA